MWVDKVLSRKEVLVFFLALSFIYIYPIVHADYAYIDDNWRSLLGAQDAWREQGRVLIEWFYELLTFGGSTTNIFPFPLMLSTCFLVVAMSRLTFWYFPKPSVSSCLVVLPILCNPFFLGNLTYQYDGPAMILAVVAVICAMTCRVESTALRGLVVALLLAVTLGLYQLVIALFVGLCVVEFYLGVKAKAAVGEVLSLLAQRVGQLAVGGLVYFFSAYQMAVDSRGRVYPFNNHWVDEVVRKFVFSMTKINLLVTPGNGWLCALVLSIALVGFVFFMNNIPEMKGGGVAKSVIGFLYIMGVPVLVLMVPGIMLFLVEPNQDARNYIAFSAVLVFLFMLNYEMLGRLQTRLRLLLVVPVLFMFSFCYAYGQVIVAKKELESALAQYVAYDLVSQGELRDVDKFYFVGPVIGGNWLPRGHAAMTYMPLLRYILSGSNTVLHPQFFTRLGINNVVEGRREEFNALAAASSEKPLIDRKLYSIHLRAGKAFIVMKDFVEPENYSDN
jgi:hypothetical protein